MALGLFKLMGRVLFVLIFITTGYEKLSQPTKFLPILSERYTKFEKFLTEKGVQLPTGLSSLEIIKKLPVINQLIAYEMITFGIGVLCFIPYMSLGISLHLFVFTVIMNNPLYHRYESPEFYHEIGQVVLSIAAFGISLMFLGNGGISDKIEGIEKLNKVEEEREEKEESSGEKGKKEKKEKKSNKSNNRREN